uniref:Ig-like domain-containing protein n=1 Tax=Chelonoidis abingdonii TaxID=106734 RepID=A0A8C0IST0_CHEAB
ATPTPPSVFPLVPCCTKTGNAPPDTSLACLVTGYFPSPVEIKWNSGKVTQGVTTFPEVTMSNGRFTQSSLLIIPARSRQGNTNQCDVTHQGTISIVFFRLSTLFELVNDVSLHFSACLRSSLDPTIYLTKPSYEDVIINSGHVTCLVLGYDSAASRITWKVDGQVSSALSYQLVPVEIFAQPSPECLLLSPPGVSNSNQHPLEVSLLPPSLKDLYIVQNTTISSLVSGMETPGSLEVSWNRGSGGPLAVVSRDPVLQEDGTYSVTSILQVCVEEWQAGEKFTCTVKHQDFPSAIVKTIRKIHGKNSAFPLLVWPELLDSVHGSGRATITCLASGFQPRDILVTWTQQDRSVPLEAYTNVGPVREAGKEERYFIYSKLSVLASEWERGDTYACVVGHEGLPMTFIHQSVDKFWRQHAVTVTKGNNGRNH